MTNPKPEADAPELVPGPTHPKRETGEPFSLASAWRGGCRCDGCRAWKAQRMRAYRARKRERKRAE